MNGKSRIDQQIYTRERRGLFRASEGYDSVAKSAGLTDGFVKDSLHPYCVYNPSRKLQSENAPSEDYPYAFTVVRFPDGRTLAGRAAYVHADFTGQRATFFAHNYVLPTGVEFEPGMLRRISFMDGYDISRGSELPELEKLPGLDEGTEPDGQREPERFPAPGEIEVNLTYSQFAKLISFIFQSAAGTKKIFLQTPAEPRLTSDYAIDLLEILFACLPPFLVKSLGFLTYAREPENKKGLNIVFLEANSIRQGDPRVSRDFFMDLSRDAQGGSRHSENLRPDAPRSEDLQPGNRHYGNLSLPENPYASFIWENAGDSGALTAFYNFASAFKEELTLAHWDNLITIYKILRENGLQNESNVFRAVTRSFLNSVRNRPSNSPSDPETAIYLSALARNVETSLFAAYVNFLLDSKAADAFLPYAEKCFTQAAVPAALFTEVKCWLENVPRVFELAKFINLICQKAGGFLDEASDPIGTAKVLYEYVKEFFSAGQKELTIGLGDVIDEHLMPRLDFENLTRAQLGTLPPAFINRGKSGKNTAPYLTLEILKKLSHSLDAEEVKIDLRHFIGSYKLPKENGKFLLGKLKEFYSGYVREPHFENLTALMEGAELLTFVNANCPDVQTRAEFLLWALDAKKIKPGDPRHWEAVKIFIKSNVKDNAFKERIYANPTLKELARQLRFGKLAGILK